MVDRETKNELISNSRKMSKALAILKRKYTNREVRNKLNENLEKEISEGNFSKLKNAYYKKTYLPDINVRSYHQVFSVLDPMVKKEFGKEWDEKLKEYVGNLEPYSKRLNGLIGVWEGYSWDFTTSHLKGAEYIHIFKVQIISTDNIICTTQKASLKADKIAIVENRIIIELTNTNRKIFLISNIGLVDEEGLSKENTLYLSYCDTGDKKVKAGLAVMKRTDKKYDEIIAESKEASFIKEPHLIEFLRNKQLIIN